MEKAHNVLLKFPAMWTISKWPILMRLPRVIRKLMVSQIIALCQLITLLCVESACDYCLAGISSSVPYIQNHGKKFDFCCWSWALPSAPPLAASRAGAQLGSSSHLCPTLTPTHWKTQPKCLGGLLGLAQTPNFAEHLSPKSRINTVLKLNFFPVIYFHVLITTSCGV